MTVELSSETDGGGCQISVRTQDGGGSARCGAADEHECAGEERDSRHGVAVGRPQAPGRALGGDFPAEL